MQGCQPPTSLNIENWFVQILVDSNHQELAMKQKPQKDVIDIVSFDLIGLLPTNHIIYIIYKLWHIRVKSGKWMLYNIILFDGAYFLLAVMVVGQGLS